MGLFRALSSLLVLHLLQGSNASLVQLNENGYEDVIIAIDPAVPEDGEIIEQIKAMVTAASTYLFEATEKRFFFKTVSVLIPETWKENPQYRRPKHESYKHADVIVAPPALPGGDAPYTRQFTECGERGEYIHFTPDFVLGRKQNEYGPSGRLLVHEWAHLRWGVFDEYSEDQPFYIGKSKKIEATRQCSTGITGTNSVYTCQGGSCITRRCRIDPTTKLYEKDCQFFPDKVQTEKASIMFMQSIDSVVEFCNEKNHNQEAPSLQNLKCNYRSTWEVIRESEDFNRAVPITGPPFPPAFSLLRISERIVCLVLDKSGSMSGSNRLNRMNQAAKHFLLQTVENGSWVGMVQFDSGANINSELIRIRSNSERDTLVKSLPTQAKGGTSICSGLRTAFQVMRNKDFPLDGSEIVLLTDGEDSTASSCVDEVKESGAIIHFIALGPQADQAVIQMSNITGGNHFYASDNAENNGLIDAFAALTSENADPSQKSIQLESKGLKLINNAWMNDTVIMDSTVGKDTFFLVTWTVQPPSISLWNPSGTLTAGFTQDTASRMAYLSIPGNAQVGTWTYSLQAKANSEILTITVTSQAANSAVPPITVNAKMNKDTNSFPSPMIVYAEVQQGYAPILGANVTAVIESNTGKTEVLELLDNGAGEIEGNPPRPEADKNTQTILENFSRTASGGAFVVSGFPNTPFTDPYPPSQITDLDATPEGEEITLTWTAPGEDFDVGNVLHLLWGSNASLVQLNDNGYEDVIIAIDPAVPEDGEIIEQIKADVIVAPPALPGGDAPYTRQFTECGERAEYIHFTPDFVLGRKQNEYGPSGRLLVHEWAHLRWGVFDEYNEDRPFYSGKSKTIEATRTVPMKTSPTSPAFSLLRISERIVCLVLDKSGSMGGSNRLSRMNQAAKHFLLQTVENGSWVGMVQFDSGANINRGNHFYASDNAENNGLIDAFGALTSENADPSQKPIQLESKGLTLQNDVWMNGTVAIDSTIGKNTFFLITWSGQPPSISLWAPNGTSIKGFTEDTASKMAYLTIPGNAQVGTWTYSLRAKTTSEILTITVTSQAANSAVLPITVNAKMNKDTNSFPSPMIVYAEVQQGYAPILGVNVTAVIESNSGKTEILELLDNGAGEIEGNPPRPEADKNTQTILENFSRTASGGAFVVSGFPNTPFTDPYPPSQITDLDATPEGEEITLTWTAPGEDFDVGNVQRYIIRISGNMIDLRDNFDDALQVNTTDLLPKEANSKETFTFKPGNIPEENATHIFIAIQSVDKSNLISKVSNIAQVALFIPQADLGPDQSHPNPSPEKNYNFGVNISILVLSVVGSAILVTIILSTTICILKKKNSSSRPRTGF
ncbi:Calcium-activated chloride channel regulator 4 [Fukomys damarensis]|uniref:Calcium-activated chloride channel regulator 4 n=1 Tax=Fukomys damarensis TaxID=885580 RepID=A0A091DYX4_FUKDA|nr:Calcium-activated chloride channel regulator 4 [Fukomys damarensis]